MRLTSCSFSTPQCPVLDSNQLAKFRKLESRSSRRGVLQKSLWMIQPPKSQPNRAIIAPAKTDRAFTTLTCRESMERVYLKSSCIVRFRQFRTQSRGSAPPLPCDVTIIDAWCAVPDSNWSSKLRRLGARSTRQRKNVTQVLCHSSPNTRSCVVVESEASSLSTCLSFHPSSEVESTRSAENHVFRMSMPCCFVVGPTTCRALHGTSVLASSPGFEPGTLDS